MPERRFTLGLWTVGNPGRDPFGEPMRAPVDPVDSVRKLHELSRLQRRGGHPTGALQFGKAMRSMDMGHELGATIYVLGRARGHGDGGRRRARRPR